jgi:hypothetical protein
MSEKRRVKMNGEDLGEYSIDQLYRMATRKEIDYTAEFLSEKTNAWLPLAGIIDDLDTTVTADHRIQQMKEAGITRVKILGSGTKEDCPVCRSLCKETYPIDNVPMLPPEGCTCIPWCRLIVVAKA